MCWEVQELSFFLGERREEIWTAFFLLSRLFSNDLRATRSIWERNWVSISPALASICLEHGHSIPQNAFTTLSCVWIDRVLCWFLFASRRNASQIHTPPNLRLVWVSLFFPRALEFRRKQKMKFEIDRTSRRRAQSAYLPFR